MNAPPTLEQVLAPRTGPAAPELVETLPDHALRCHACGHRCRIADGFKGVCKVRFNRGGTLLVPRGYVAALQCDPIEKKPFFHAFAGHDALSFGMLGCDLHCGYCQNWVTSQALRDPVAGAAPDDVSPQQLVATAKRLGAPVVVSTYNEPLITAEWAIEVFRAAKEAGLTCGFVSNGNGTEQVLDYIRPWVDLYKVDLKGFDDRHYRELGGLLPNVLKTIERLVARGFWVEIVTLVVPGFNDSEAELRGVAKFLAGVSRDIPWHVTAFHQDYKMTENANTTAEQLVRAAGWGKEAGLRHVYAGNLPGEVGDFENTRCPSCNALLVGRFGYHIRTYRIRGGACPDCGTAVAGRWRDEAGGGPGYVRPMRNLRA
jgi:pyruvate formate lyase activating enzyme